MAEGKCPKCGATVKIEPGVHFIKCPYCDTMLFIDRSGVMFYYILPFFINEAQANDILRRWFAASDKPKDLETTARVLSMEKIYFPVYMFKRNINGKVEVITKPARGTILPGLHSLQIPGGDIKVFDESFDTGGAKLMDVDIPMQQYLTSLPGQPEEQALVYFPIYQVKYNYRGMDYSVIINGSTGEVYADNAPTKSSMPYEAVAATGFIMALAGTVGGYYNNGICLLIPVGFILSLAIGYIVAKKM